MKLKNVKIEKIESLYQDAVLVTTTDGVQIEVDGEWSSRVEEHIDENGEYTRVDYFNAEDMLGAMAFHNCTKNGYDSLYNECLWAPDDPDHSGLTEECSYAVADAILDYCKNLKDGVSVIFWDYKEKRKAISSNGSEDDNARKNVGLSELCGDQKPLPVSEAYNGSIMTNQKSKILN